MPEKRFSIFVMANRSASFYQLCQCFRGLPTAETDWMSVIGLANQTMTTPALIESVQRSPEIVPRDASSYITEIYERNLVRNDRLLVQLMEAVAALNGSRITPAVSYT